MHFSKLEMKFIGFSFLVSENKIISGEVRKDIYWSLNWYMCKFIHHFSDKLMVLFTISFFFRDRLDIVTVWIFSFLVSENKIISGEVRKDIFWSLNWYMFKFIHHFFR